MANLSIGEIARCAGIQPSAIRYYESMGLLPVPERTSGQRRYSADTVLHLTAISLAQQAGFTIAEMKLLFDGPKEESVFVAWDALTRQKMAEMDAAIERAQQMKALLGEIQRCGCLSLETCPLVLNSNYVAFGE